MKYLEILGRKIINFIHYVGGLSVLFAQTIYCTFKFPPRLREILFQAKHIGVNSLPVVFLTSLFTGAILAFQSAYQMEKISAEIYIASLVALSMTRELGPVFTALVVAGRVGAAATAEVGTMKVTEQIDALETLAVNPVRYLVVPRFLAIVIMLPLLTIYANFIGMLGGYIVGVGKLNISSSLYLRMTYESLLLKDIFSGLFKSFIFAMIICIVACFEGFNATGGAQGVGKSTTLSVVNSFILIIAANCFFAAIFYFIL